MAAWESKQVSYVDVNVLLSRNLLARQQHVTEEEIWEARLLINKPRIRQKFFPSFLCHCLFYVPHGSHHFISFMRTLTSRHFFTVSWGSASIAEKEDALGFCLFLWLNHRCVPLSLSVLAFPPDLVHSLLSLRLPASRGLSSSTPCFQVLHRLMTLKPSSPSELFLKPRSAVFTAKAAQHLLPSFPHKHLNRWHHFPC